LKVIATTPNRIDLAGGTLDIYPLYVFENGGLTVNLGIDIGSRVEVETRDDGRVVLHSRDLGTTEEYSSVAAVEAGHELDLLARAVRFYAPPCGVTVTTKNDAPRGSGLGASSALLMALSGALARVSGSDATRENFIDWGANLEAQNIAIPTGKQDYYGAIYGGASAIWFELRGNRRESLDDGSGFLDELERHLVLSFTGISHFSGTNNWAMMKRYIDGEGDTVERLREIKATAFRMREALLGRDLRAVARVLDEEWRQRKGLAEGVSTSEIERMIAAAQGAGAYASKICGAGGGGCMVTLAPPERREAVIAALGENGARHLPCRIRREGLKVETVAVAV
jgi:D-glycero-alpha-D-manno-heptose-7-phosphate kinase